MNQIRTRIAPSPTGLFHPGTARTALTNYLFARKNGGVFVLRIEDTDLERSDKKYEKDIIDGLRWLGIEWDEGVEVGGDFGPYHQTERVDTYSKYIQKLLDEGKAFYCWHTKEELEKEKNEQMERKESPRHVCEHKKDKEAQEKKDKANTIIRLDMPDKKVSFKDMVRGKVEFDSKLLGDISLAKNIETPLYNFAVVIDDFEMQISHVIRGEDHISNTPKQIIIGEALGFERPEFGHLPLLLGTDKSKLSKRHGVISVTKFKEEGYLPEAILNFLALLGWNPGDDKEIFSIKELIEEFSIEKIQKGGAVFNVEKLDWINGQYIRQLDIDTLTDLCIPYLKKSGLI